MFPVRAEVVDLGAFSVHADQRELIEWLDTAERPPEIVYIVHGEPASASTLQAIIEEPGDRRAVIARDGERVRLD